MPLHYSTYSFQVYHSIFQVTSWAAEAFYISSSSSSDIVVKIARTTISGAGISCYGCEMVLIDSNIVAGTMRQYDGTLVVNNSQIFGGGSSQPALQYYYTNVNVVRGSLISGSISHSYGGGSWGFATDNTAFKRSSFCVPGKYGNETLPPIILSTSNHQQNALSTSCNTCGWKTILDTKDV